MNVCVNTSYNERVTSGFEGVMQHEDEHNNESHKGLIYEKQAGALMSILMNEWMVDIMK